MSVMCLVGVLSVAICTPVNGKYLWWAKYTTANYQPTKYIFPTPAGKRQIPVVGEIYCSKLLTHKISIPVHTCHTSCVCCFGFDCVGVLINGISSLI